MKEKSKQPKFSQPGDSIVKGRKLKDIPGYAEWRAEFEKKPLEDAE